MKGLVTAFCASTKAAQSRRRSGAISNVLPDTVVDDEGRVTVVGFTYAADFPTTDCALDDICGSGGAPWNSDLFIGSGISQCGRSGQMLDLRDERE